MSPNIRRVALVVSVALLAIGSRWSLVHSQTAPTASSVDLVILKAYQWRSIGPQNRGGGRGANTPTCLRRANTR